MGQYLQNYLTYCGSNNIYDIKSDTCFMPPALKGKSMISEIINL